MLAALAGAAARRARSRRSTSTGCSPSPRRSASAPPRSSLPDVASLVAVDNGTTAPGQNSSEFGVTIAMADMTGPFDYHLTRKLVELCTRHDIRYQKDVFRYYRSDSRLARSRPAPTCAPRWSPSASTPAHGYERIHIHALRSLRRARHRLRARARSTSPATPAPPATSRASPASPSARPSSPSARPPRRRKPEE